MKKNRAWKSAFDLSDFQNPQTDFAPVYGWIWNGVVTEEETDRQLDEMASLGIRFIYVIPEPKMFRPTSLPTVMEPDYLTPPYFEAFRYAMDGAKKRGMKLWLYDEGGWPSGGACGKVLTAHPEYARRNLAVRTVRLPAGEPYVPAEGTIASFVKETERMFAGVAFAEETEIDEYFSERHLFNADENMTSDYPDVTVPGATEEFIRLTHEGYRPALSHLFGEDMTAVFTDEPSAPRPMFRPDLAEAFEKENGYSVLPFLPYLMGKPAPEGKAAEAVCAWFDLCSREFCRNYLMKEKTWSNENGMAFIGHMDIDNVPNGSVRGGNFNLMRALRCLDIPGVDAIWRQIFPCEKKEVGGSLTGENNFFPRFASSAAAQSGSRFALTESAGVYGAGVDFNELRWVLTFQAIRGINIFNLLSVPYRREGFNMTGELPIITEKHAHFADLKPFNRYLERLSYVTSVGKRNCEIGLYLPMRDFYIGGEAEKRALDFFQSAGFSMEEAHLDFDFIDDDVLLNATLTDGLQIGFAKYKTVVIEDLSMIPDKVKERLQAFRLAGGKVIGRNEIASLTAPLSFVGGEGLRVMERTLDNGRLFLISNERFTPTDAAVKTDGRKFRALNLTDGTLSDLPGDGKMHLESGELIGLLETEETFPGIEAHDVKEIREVSGFTLRRLSRFRIGEMAFETETYEGEQTVPVSLGDWKAGVGEDYSGNCIYETDFSADGGEGLEIDLGEVKTTAEVLVNGVSCGVRVMKPYRFVCNVPLKERNSLAVRVTNTPANEYLHTKSFDKWQRWQLTGYFAKQRTFDKDALPSGLFGPVKLYFVKNRKEK